MRIRIPEKLSLTLFLIVAALALPWSISAGLVLLLVLVRSLIPALGPMDLQAARRFWKVFFLLSMLVAVMILANGVLMQTGEPVFDLGLVQLYDAGLRFGLITGCRLLLIATAFLVFFGSTSITDIAHYLNRIGLPGPIVTTVLLALHFLDQLPERIQQIFIAQESRGAPVRGSLVARVRSFLLLLTPLVLSSIVESIDRGTALELRGFHSGISLRPVAREPESRPWSAVTLTFVLLSALLIIFRLVTWLIPSR